jgi:hypothetical protein
VKQLVASARRALPHASGSVFVTRMDHGPTDHAMRLPVWNVRSERDTTWTVTPYHGRVYALDSIIMPDAYVVPRELSAVTELLARHRVRTTVVEKPERARMGEYAIDSIGVVVIEEDSLPAPRVRLIVAEHELRPGDVVVPTAQLHALFLATTLEPTSLWGLLKYPSLAGDLVANGRYRILRR